MRTLALLISLALPVSGCLPAVLAIGVGAGAAMSQERSWPRKGWPWFEPEESMRRQKRRPFVPVHAVRFGVPVDRASLAWREIQYEGESRERILAWFRSRVALPDGLFAVAQGPDGQWIFVEARDVKWID